MAAPVTKPGREKTFTMRLPAPLSERLLQIAKSRGQHRQELITAILREWVAEHGD
jgi:predicted DNA-binding protein